MCASLSLERNRPKLSRRARRVNPIVGTGLLFRGHRGCYGSALREEEPMTTARRGFLKSLALAPLAPAALEPQGVPPASPSVLPPGADATVADALTEVVRREFGAHLDAAELEAVKRELAHNLESASLLRRSAGLVNADEPVARFDARPPAAVEKGGRR
jgi:hypothetical protein